MAYTITNTSHRAVQLSSDIVIPARGIVKVETYPTAGNIEQLKRMGILIVDQVANVSTSNSSAGISRADFLKQATQEIKAAQKKAATSNKKS